MTCSQVREGTKRAMARSEFLENDPTIKVPLFMRINSYFVISLLSGSAIATGRLCHCLSYKDRGIQWWHLKKMVLNFCRLFEPLKNVAYASL